MKDRNLATSMKSAEISNWKTQTIGHLASTRHAIDSHFRSVEARAKAHAARFSAIMKPVFVGMGFYTGVYGLGIGGREALKASSNQRRETFRQSMMGVPEGEQTRIFDESERIGGEYPSVKITGVMEIMRSAYSLMGNVERASEVTTDMVRALVVTQSARGPDAASNQLIQFLRGMDNLGINKDGREGVDLIKQLIEAATKAVQVDPDFDAAGYFPFARRSKVAGPALSPEFLARAPVYMQDMGADSTGNALAMGFRTFLLEAVGGAGKRYLGERERIGIRDGDGLKQGQLFGSDPDRWAIEVLLPALVQDGIDLSNGTEVASAIGKLSGNTTATGFLTRMITQREQTERWLKLMDEAMGLDAAEGARHNDPYVGLEAFKSALANLSAALLPIDTVNAGLNKLADGINRLASVGNDSPLLATLGIGGAGLGAVAGGKFAFGKMADMFGLRTSALALDGSAAALTRAAIALGGAGVADSLPGKLGKAGGLALLSWPVIAGIAGVAAGTGEFIRQTSASNGADSRKPAPKTYDQGADANLANYYNAFHGVPFEGGMHRAGLGAGPQPALNSSMLLQQADETARALEDTLAITARPIVDTSSLDNAIAKARTLKGLVDGANASAAKSNVGVEMRRNFAD